MTAVSRVRYGFRQRRTQWFPDLAHPHVDGLRDPVKHGLTRWLVADGERIEDVVERALNELADPAQRARMARACAAWAAEFDWNRAPGRFAALIGAAIRTGSAQGSRAGPWVIGYPDGGHSVVAEGPVFDVLTQQAGSEARVRPATDTERLLGRPEDGRSNTAPRTSGPATGQDRAAWR